ncbi:YjbH domain-containing protein [Pseudomonas helleri]|uniref:YjbH domain-containing protein n=1 Tax=Pseudomonas helleri TaxID=1608996 RepID=UPI003FD3EFFD
MKLRFVVVILLPYGLAHAEPRYTQNDFGGVGLLQTPTARMAPVGELSLNANRTDPYSRYSLSLQPLEWLEGTFRYTALTNHKYGAEALSGNQSYKDKAVDAKARLWQESDWLPEVALGFLDIGGTGLFSSEYFVANKRFNNLDFSLGIAWGYMGNRGDIDNPLGIIDDRFDNRPITSVAGAAGDVNTSSYFRGSPSFFGGIAYQTPWAPLSLKIEYEGNDYKHEPIGSAFVQDSPINIGAVYKLNENVDLTAGWERGNTALFGITLHTNFVSRKAPAKTFDPPAQPLPNKIPATPLVDVDWAQVSKDLEKNAGYKVERIAQHDNELTVYGEQSKYFYSAKGVGRASRILDNNANGDIKWFTLVNKRYAMPIEETSVPRSTFRDVVNNDQDIVNLHRTTELNRPSQRYDNTLFQQKPDPFTYGFGLGYQQNMGGPDGFLLYQVSAYAEGQYRFAPGTWASGGVSANLINNFDKFKYDAPSKMPRVRTDVRKYVTTSEVTMPALQLNQARQLDQDLYGMVYGGYLEPMYAGVGAEVLYRPMGERWSIGADLNYVRQRDFEQDFGLRDYRTVTGHITTYTKLPFDLDAAISVGRYLARDWGTTIDISREFSNGVKFGGWVTRTTASAEEYGEGSFDKGIYISIPFDEMMSVSTMSRANIAWAPLTRDGGAMLRRQYSLHTMTDGRNKEAFYENFGKITD